MAGPLVLIFHRRASAHDAELVRLLAETRELLVEHQRALFLRAGAGEVRRSDEWQSGLAFGEVLARQAPARGGLVVFGSGAVPLLDERDAAQLVEVAASGSRWAVTNNRYSSDVCALGDASLLRQLPALPSDNSLPRWLEEHAGVPVDELRGRTRLALDLDTPLDIALAALARGAPGWLLELCRRDALAVPRHAELRELAADPRAELLVFGRSGSATLRWLERNVRCRVRFLAEERGLRAATPLAIGPAPVQDARGGAERPPRATLGRLLEQSGPGALADIVGELAEGAIIDTRVLLADRLGADEAGWPSDADRFASDLHRPAEVSDAWLRRLTAAASDARRPILLGAHSLVGPGIRLLMRGIERR